MQSTLLGAPSPFADLRSCSCLGMSCKLRFTSSFAIHHLLGNLGSETLAFLASVPSKLTPSNDMVLRQFVNTGFQVLFHSPPGVLFTFPSQYYALSVTKEYLALRGGPRSFHQGSTCLDVLWILLRLIGFRLRGSHPLWLAFPKPFCYPSSNVCSPNPAVHAPRFGLRRFRSPLLPASIFLSFPPAT